MRSFLDTSRMLLALSCFLIFLQSCASTAIPREYYGEIAELAQSIKAEITTMSPGAIREVVLRTFVGSTGYFTVIGRDGNYIAHPRADMLGKSVADGDPERFQYIKSISTKPVVYERKGLSGQESIVYLCQIDDGGNILCLIVPFTRSLGAPVLEDLKVYGKIRT